MPTRLPVKLPNSATGISEPTCEIPENIGEHKACGLYSSNRKSAITSKERYDHKYMAEYTEKAKTQSLPAIILRESVAFPSIPLKVGLKDEKSINALNANVDDCVFLAIVKNRITDSDNDKITNKKDLCRVGVVAKIKDVLNEGKDGFVNVGFDCLCRAELVSFRYGEEFDSVTVMCKTVAVNPDLPEAVALRERAAELFDELSKTAPNFTKEIADIVKKTDNPGQLADFIAGTVFVKNEHKQEILEIFDPIQRLARTVELLEDEMSIIKNELDLHKRTRARIEENQRDYYLREQMRVIKEELGEDGDDDDDIYELVGKITKSAMPDDIKEKMLKETKKLSKLPFASPESNVIRTYVETCLDLPFGKTTVDRTDIEAARRILEKDHDGMREIKDRILEFIAVRKLSNGNKNQILCLVGAPGVGKTSVASSIAKALKRKYVRVSLGGIRDEADIRGHRKTYVGAMPGRIINALIEAKTSNPLILLDEIDKITRDAHGDPASALLEVLDPDQNKTFRDHFVEIPFDLSDCLFIATANTLDTVPRPLLDRMEVIEMKSYSRGEKLSIAKNHLIGKQLEKHGMNRRMMKIDDDAVLEIIDHYTREAGVRGLERNIAALCRKVAKQLVEDPNKKSVHVKKSDIFGYLGPEKIQDEELSPNDEVGVVNGLAYTDAGGDLLKVEAVSMDGSGKLELTGSLGDVMIESAKIALSVVRTRAKSLGIAPDFHKTKDIHIHFPEGAVPKDGPSAGVTIVTALASELSGIPVKRDVAMTGEVTLHGRVLAIGGLREKTMAAYKAGIKTVLLPADNKQDYERLDDYIKNGMKFKFCSTVDDVLENALAQRPEIDITGKKMIDLGVVAAAELNNKNGAVHESEFCKNNP